MADTKYGEEAIAPTEPYQQQEKQEDASQRTESAEAAVKETAEELKQQAKASGERVMDRTQERAREIFHDQKDRAAHRLGSVSQALHQTGDSLQQREDKWVAMYAHSIADRVNDLSRILHDRDLDEMGRDIQRYAKRRPEVFLLGALVGGFLLARFAKSSAKD